MKLSLKKTALLTLTTTCLLISAAAQNVSGTWTLYLPALTHPLTLEQNGSQISGEFNASGISGSVSNNQITFKQFERGGTFITYTGTVTGNTMQGTAIGVRDNHPWPWHATRGDSPAQATTFYILHVVWKDDG